MKLYLLALIAKVIAIVSMVLYLPLHVLNSISDYLFQYSGCAEFQKEEEDALLDELNNNDEKEEDYE